MSLTAEQRKRRLAEKNNCQSEIAILKGRKGSFSVDFNAYKEVSKISGFNEQFNRIENFKSKLKTDKKERLVAEMLGYLFVKYTVPIVLHSAMIDLILNQKRMTIFGVDVKDWYFCYAKGGSLYKEFAKDVFTKKELHVFLNQKHGLSLIQAAIYAVAICAGASDKKALLMATRSKIGSAQLGRDSFNRMREIVSFFSRDGFFPDTVEGLNDILDYVIRENVVLSGRGFTLSSIKKQTIDWHYKMKRSKALSGEKWAPFEIQDWMGIIENDWGEEEVWVAEQIVNGAELAQEGSEQRHCVYSYLRDCKVGSISIWSIKKSEKSGAVFKRRLTVEVNSSFQIVQVRGKANTLPNAREKKILKRWAQESCLEYIGLV